MSKYKNKNGFGASKSVKQSKVNGQSYWRFINPIPYNDFFYPRLDLDLFNCNIRGFFGLKTIIKNEILSFCFYRTKLLTV